MTSETFTLFTSRTEYDGVIRLEKWPEGYVLWYHGEIAWKSWAALSTRPAQEPVAWALKRDEVILFATTTKNIAQLGAENKAAGGGEVLPLYAAPQTVQEPVAVAIVPPYCSGSALSFDPGVLHVSKDGSGYIAINEDDFVLEDDQCEGPDGPEGSVHWITRMDASELVALRDFLNCNAVAAPQPVLSQPEVKAMAPVDVYKVLKRASDNGRLSLDFISQLSRDIAALCPLSDIPAQAGEVVTDNQHEFVPNKKYPWFCAHCGYAPHEPLMHVHPAATASEGSTDV